MHVCLGGDLGADVGKKTKTPSGSRVGLGEAKLCEPLTSCGSSFLSPDIICPQDGGEEGKG